MEKLKVGLVGTSQLSFPGDKNGVFRKSAERLEDISKDMNFELITYRDTVITEEDARKSVAELEGHNLDYLLVQHTSYSAGNLSLVFARMKNIRIGLWAIPEYSTDGIVPFNSLCSINMHQSIIYHYLKDYRIKVKWFFGDVNDQQFKTRLHITVHALRAIKKLNKSRIALVGGVASGFNDLYNDERQFLKLFDGMTFNRLHEYDELKSIALSISDYEAESMAERILTMSCGASRHAMETLLISAKFYLAYKKFIVDNKYDAVAVSCWPKFQNDFKYSVCSVIAQLNDEGTPVGCEGDVVSTICMLALKYLADDITMLMDLSAFDETDESILMWHCGPSSSRFGQKYTLDANYSGLPHVPGEEPKGCGVTRNMVFDEMPVTAFRLTGECDKYMLLEGDFMGGKKKSFIGSRGWMENIKMYGEPIKVKDLINTIQVNGFQHHYPMVPGHLASEVKEFAAWLGLKQLEKVPYADYLQVID